MQMSLPLNRSFYDYSNPLLGIFRYTLILLIFLGGLGFSVNAQETEGKLGGWYAYLWNTRFQDSEWGLMGDFQYRGYGVANDFQQFILRGGVSYTPKNSGLTLLTGYSYFNSGAIGEPNPQTWEHRLYQDVLFSQSFFDRLFIAHRLRIEERFIEDQDYQTRFRYFIAGRVPFNKKSISKNAIYAVVTNETFINAQRQTGNGNTKPLFDRNWLATGIGYSFTDSLRLESFYMRESTEFRNKGQLWFMLFHTF